MVFPLAGAYHASKYAVEALSDALRLELAAFGIGVALVEPGYIKTEFAARTMDLLAKYIADASSPYASVLSRARDLDASLQRYAVGPESVSRAIEHAATARRARARYVAPFYNVVGIWLTRMFPTRLVDWAMRKAAGIPGAPQLPAGEAPRRLASA